MTPEIYQDEDGGDYCEGMLERMFALAAGLSAPVIVEIGTRSGNSLRIWAAAVASNGGEVFSVDVVYQPGWPIPARCILFVSSSHTVPWSRPIDLLYMDGDHTRVGCQRDIEAWWPKVKPGGHLLFHDVTNAGHHRDLIPPIADLARTQKISFEIWPNQCGMAHLVKP